MRFQMVQRRVKRNYSVSIGGDEICKLEEQKMGHTLCEIRDNGFYWYMYIKYNRPKKIHLRMICNNVAFNKTQKLI